MNPKASPLSWITAVLTLGWSDSVRGRIALRRAVSHAAQAALRMRGRPIEESLPSPVLVVAPHPDDETFGCGGTLALLAKRQVQIDVAFVTDGGGSHPLNPQVTPAALAIRRVAEARMATGLLGIDWDRVTFLGAPDGALSSMAGEKRREIVDRMVALVQRIAPAVILLPCGNDGSSEHDASFAMVRSAVKQAAISTRLIEFPVWSWWNPVLLLRSMSGYRKVWLVHLGEARDTKAAAIAQYSSQTLPIPPDTAAALPEGFASMFLGGEEFLLER